MKHVIIGAGVVGTATGVWLKANREEVIFCDIKPEVLLKLKNKGFNVTSTIEKIQADIYWICTAEWDAEKILSILSKRFKDPTIVIRSTMPPGSTEKLAKKYKVKHVAHIPEFLREKTAISDIFDENRIVIGVRDEETKAKLQKVFEAETAPKIFTDTTTSELIKYASNCWLATQISYWNEIKKISDKLGVNPQMVANAACLDRRISRYGTAMLGDAFGGFCFPKDLNALIQSFDANNLEPILLKAVRKVNEKIKKEKQR
jgi:UDPglucose 6-dehydrogenase